MITSNDAMKQYMQSISEYPLVTTDEEAILAAKIAKGDGSARQKLINSNLRLVVKIAHDFKGNGLPLLDLISEGNIGLMKAVERFDPTKGAKLSSYAAWWIKQAMRRALLNQPKVIRIPGQTACKIVKIQAAKAKLINELGRDPTDEELAEAAEVSVRTLTTLKLGKAATISLQAPIQNGEDGEFHDIIPDEKTKAPDHIIQDEETIQHTIELVTELDERERTILTLRFGLDGSKPKTLEEVSKTIGRTRERVRQIQNQALDKMKKRLEEYGYSNGEQRSLFTQQKRGKN